MYLIPIFSASCVAVEPPVADHPILISKPCHSTGQKDSSTLGYLCVDIMCMVHFSRDSVDPDPRYSSPQSYLQYIQ